MGDKASANKGENGNKAILIRLRTRPARTAFRWVKGHDDNYGNNRADALANEGRDSNEPVEIDDEAWIDNHTALQDGALCG